MLSNFNLSDYYKKCREIFNVSPQRVSINQNYSYQEHIVVNESNRYSISLILPEIVCAACGWVIERALHHKFPDIEMHLNLAQKSVIVSVKTAQRIYEVINCINSIGFNAIPITHANQYVMAQQRERELLLKLGVAGLAMFFVMMLSICIWAGKSQGAIGEHSVRLLYILSFFITVPAVLFTAGGFFENALRSLRTKIPDFNLAVSIGIVLTLMLSVFNTLNSAGYAYYDSTLSLVFILISGKYLECRIKNRAIFNNNQRINHLNKEYTKLNENGATETVKVLQIKTNDELIVPLGTAIPVDAILLDEVAYVDKSSLCGEVAPFAVAYGEKLTSGCINVGSPIRIRALSTYDDSYLNKLAAQIETTPNNTRSASLANTIARYFTPILFLLALLAFSIGVVMEASIYEGFYRMITLLVITCPCAVGIAIPLAYYVTASSLRQFGIMIKNPKSLEQLATLKNFVLDKTGTLTQNIIHYRLPKLSTYQEQVLATLVHNSSHPILRPLQEMLRHVELLRGIKVQEQTGRGVYTELQDGSYFLGRKEGENAQETLYFIAPTHEFALQYTVQTLQGVDALLNYLKKRECNLWLLSGDSEQNVRAFTLLYPQFDEQVRAGQTAAQKYEFCEDLKVKKGPYVMMGDGLNDARAMQAANVAIAPSKGVDLTRGIADIFYMEEHVEGLVRLLKAAQKFRRVVIQNFTFAFLYNLIAVVVAMLGLATPLYAAIFMGLSSLTVVINSLRCKDYRLYHHG